MDAIDFVRFKGAYPRKPEGVCDAGWTYATSRGTRVCRNRGRYPVTVNRHDYVLCGVHLNAAKRDGIE